MAVINDGTRPMDIPASGGYTSYFAKSVNNVKASVNVTQTQIAGKAESHFTFFFQCGPDRRCGPACAVHGGSAKNLLVSRFGPDVIAAQARLIPPSAAATSA